MAVQPLMTRVGGPKPVTALSLRRLRVIVDRRARADQIAVAIDIVDPPDRAPILIRARHARRETALRAAIGAGPRIVGAVRHGMRGMAQRRGLDLPAAGPDPGALVAGRRHRAPEPRGFG